MSGGLITPWGRWVGFAARDPIAVGAFAGCLVAASICVYGIPRVPGLILLAALPLIGALIGAFWKTRTAHRVLAVLLAVGVVWSGAFVLEGLTYSGWAYQHFSGVAAKMPLGSSRSSVARSLMRQDIEYYDMGDGTVVAFYELWYGLHPHRQRVEFAFDRDRLTGCYPTFGSF